MGKNGETYNKNEYEKSPNKWYDYTNGEWANIKTTSIATDTNGNPLLEAYWVWIPRFAYKLPENGHNAKKIEVIFVKNDTKKGVLEDGTEVDCYYATDSEITTGGTGLYKNSTALAKGTESGKEQTWIVHPAFW